MTALVFGRFGPFGPKLWKLAARRAESGVGGGNTQKRTQHLNFVASQSRVTVKKCVKLKPKTVDKEILSTWLIKILLVINTYPSCVT